MSNLSIYLSMPRVYVPLCSKFWMNCCINMLLRMALQFSTPCIQPMLGPPAFHTTGAYKNARDWLMRFKGLTEDQAITLLTVAGDFAITQVVDGNCESSQCFCCQHQNPPTPNLTPPLPLPTTTIKTLTTFIPQ
jgi:hypothetical protein